jgi:hypothetical protein
MGFRALPSRRILLPPGKDGGPLKDTGTPPKDTGSSPKDTGGPPSKDTGVDTGPPPITDPDAGQSCTAPIDVSAGGNFTFDTCKLPDTITSTCGLRSHLR